MQQTLEENLHEDAHRAHHDNRRIVNAAGHDLFDIGLHLKIRANQCRAAEHEEQSADKHQHDAVRRCAVDALRVLCAQRTGDHRVQADAQTDRHRDHQVLNRERDAQRGQRVFAYARHKHGIDHVIQGLHQHGNHDRQAHRKEQLAHRHHAHFIFLWDFILNILFNLIFRIRHGFPLSFKRSNHHIFSYCTRLYSNMYITVCQCGLIRF